MRMISGAILILAAVIAFCVGQTIEYATWYRQKDMPLVLEIIGGLLGIVGAVVFVWGCVRDGSQKST